METIQHWEESVAMAKKKIPRTPFLNPKFSAAVKEFGIALLKSQSIKHRGNRGAAREKALSEFFIQNLPDRFTVTEGEITDLLGSTSPQMDLIFYDKSRDFPFNTDGSDILAAEAALVTIEVKSKITNTEILKSVKAAKSLRRLKPFGKPLAGSDVENKLNKSGGARYFHCIFAYETDLIPENWLFKENDRIQKASGGEHLIDAIYVLGSGLIQLTHSKGREEDEDGGAITNLYFSILNFIQRESRRRKETPYERYTQPQSKAWTSIKKE